MRRRPQTIKNRWFCGGGHYNLFMIDRHPSNMHSTDRSKSARVSERLIVLNKFGPSGQGEAQVQYLDGDFRVISPGS